MANRLTQQALAATLALAAGSSAWAVEYGTVVSVTPVRAATPLSQRLCSDEPVVVQAPNNGAGAVLGAIAGGVLGYQLGGGVGQAVATGLGMVAGAAVGDQMQANNNPPVSTTAQRCRNVTQYDNRLVGYDVVYDYQGVRRSTRMAQDPGNRIALDINVAPAGSAAPVRGGGVYLVPSGTPSPEMGDGNNVYDEVAPVPRVVYGAPSYAVEPSYYAVPGAYYAVPGAYYAGPRAYYGPSVYINPWPAVVLRGGGWRGGWSGGRHHH